MRIWECQLKDKKLLNRKMNKLGKLLKNTEEEI